MTRDPLLSSAGFGVIVDGASEERWAEVFSHLGIDNWEDLESLAALIEGCDLVVTVGNATAHLSGALGQRTWMLLYVAGWRWLRGRRDSLLAKFGREVGDDQQS